MIVLNFANPDMVGHTGSLPAAIRRWGYGHRTGQVVERSTLGRRCSGHRRPRQLRADADPVTGGRTPRTPQSGAGAAGGRRRRHARGRPARDLAPTMLARWNCAAERNDRQSLLRKS